MSKENKGIITILYQLIITIKERDAKTASLSLCADKDKKKARQKSAGLSILFILICLFT